jgi:glutamate dehydrogenase/leucine dehydrogenase
MAAPSLVTPLDLEFDHEALGFFHDPETGLVGAVAIHSTSLGPAMGGVRLMAYPNSWALIEDGLRLSRAMTFKNAAAGIALGGGKAVLLDDGQWDKRRPERLRSLAQIIDGLDGRYVAAEDVGTTSADMDAMRLATRWVAGTSGDAGGRGDPSTATAETVLAAIRSAVHIALESDLCGVRVGVLGVGSVGSRVARALAAEGAELWLADVDAERVRAVARECGGTVVPADGFVSREFDVLAPCALGKVVTRANARALNSRIVAGAANNQLEDDAVAEDLARAGILYVPDFVANCGGIIHVGAEFLGLTEVEVRERIDSSIATTEELLRFAVASKEPPLWGAYRKANQQLASPTRQRSLAA